MANECLHIAKTSISGITAMPAYQEQIKIEYKIGKDGILEVKATSISNETNQKRLKVDQDNINLHKEEIERCVAEAEIPSEEDASMLPP